MTIPPHGPAARTALPRRSSEFFSEHFIHPRSAPGRPRVTGKKALRVMKFGGTSVGDAACIRRVVEIIQSAASEGHVVVVVSAMSGVTNQLVAAATHAEAGCGQTVAAIFEELGQKHHTAIEALIGSVPERERVANKIEDLLAMGNRLCQGTMLLGELTPRTRDAISSLGERLSILLVAAALTERGTASEAIEATRLVVTDANHGGADPCMDRTRQRCHEYLLPRLQQGVVPVVTGFIGATVEGVLTTLGRGGSDYSATILGAALDADEVVIWTDVDGLQTADPRLVPGARTIPEISYREAAELAFFGARVLHPKTLRAVTQCGIPLWIRNSFAPERMGTKITPMAAASDDGVKALTAIGEVSLVTVCGPAFFRVQDFVGRTLRAAAAVQTEVLLLSQASSRNDLCLVIPSAQAKCAVEALRHEFAHDEFAHDLANASMEHITVDATVAIVTVVGQNMKSIPGIVGSAFGVLGRENVNVIAIAHGSSDCTLSFVVAEKDVKAAITSMHGEFRLGKALKPVLDQAVLDQPVLDQPVLDEEEAAGDQYWRPVLRCEQVSQKQ
jgi:bifunctional aspartokinase / homoserine dehydrogenase 1